MRAKFHKSNKDKSAPPVHGEDSSYQPDAETQQLHLRQEDGQGLWQQAWKAVKHDIDWDLPESMQHAENLSIKDEVQAVQREAQDRRHLSENNQRHIFGTKYTYRQ
ncbi:MAG: hypothetical protein Q9192_005989, partial [Flavoplaca navasiana]